MIGKIAALHLSPAHTFSKDTTSTLEIITGLGVAGDAHMGEKVKHRSRVKKNPDQPNLRQVHIIHAELFEELRAKGYEVSPGQMGENITSSGLDILNLPQGTLLKVGSSTMLQVTGLRNPCMQLESIKEGLMKACLDRDESGELIRKAGIMTVVLRGGTIQTGETIEVILPPGAHQKLEAV